MHIYVLSLNGHLVNMFKILWTQRQFRLCASVEGLGQCCTVWVSSRRPQSCCNHPQRGGLTYYNIAQAGQLAVAILIKFLSYFLCFKPDIAKRILYAACAMYYVF